MEKARIFLNNRSRAVRLPKALDFPPDVEEVEIYRVGNALQIVPAGQGWDAWFDAPNRLRDAGIQLEREQPADQERGAIE
jgi:antitoxin VapB